MKTSASLYLSLRTFALSSALLLASAAHAGWGVSINLPIATQTQYSTYSSTIVSGAPGSQIISTRQVPQTVCRQAWAGSTTQQCTTEFVTVQDNYSPPQPIYIEPAPIYVSPPVYITPVPTFGYPGYGYHSNHNHGYRHQNQQVGPPPTTIYNGNSSGYGIGGYSSPNNGSINIRLNSR